MRTLAIVVNYRSAALASRAVASILGSGSLGDLAVTVVDNSEDKAEAARLLQGLPEGVRLLVSPGNLGFGRACNLACERDPADLILLLNPDAELLPGCLHRLEETLLTREDYGAVSPRVYWDAAGGFSLPSSYPLDLLEWQTFFSGWGFGERVNGWLGRYWRAHSVRLLKAGAPRRVKNLSGAVVLVKSEATRRAGGLFDPRFFLYYEDTDLFLRLRKKGFRLLVDPRAGAVHRYDQCGREDLGEKRGHMEVSRRVFVEKHRRDSARLLEGLGRGIARKGRAGAETKIGPIFRRPFRLEVPAGIREGWVFEVSPNRTFIPSAMGFGKGPVMDFREDVWRLLAPGRYFGRLGSENPWGTLGNPVSWVIEAFPRSPEEGGRVKAEAPGPGHATA